jgi:RNase H-fold protein (predicted Holliday junction resolvase)
LDTLAKKQIAATTCILAIDPGRKKCGLAVVSAEKGILDRMVVPCEEFSQTVRDLFEKHQPQTVLLGSSTGSKPIGAVIRQSLKIEPKLVDEKHTTELAKLRYFREYPPKGLWKLVPLGLQTPPTCYDDFAAVVMAERYLEKECRDDRS